MNIQLKDSNGLPLYPITKYIGAIYIQLRNQNPPSDIFGGTWENITSLYAGEFFRAEGGNAVTFGNIQKEELPNIVGSTGHMDTTSSSAGVDATYVGNTGAISTSSQTGSGSPVSSTTWDVQDRINFNASNTTGTGNGIYKEGGHVIPYNSTIRIWRRVS